MDITVPIITGLLGFVGGIGTTFVTYALRHREAHRGELREAYVRWATNAVAAMEERSRLGLFDHIARQRRCHPEIANIPSSPMGRSRKEQVKAALETMGDLKAAEARLLLLESVEAYRHRIRQLSRLWLDNTGTASEAERVATMLESRSAYSQKLDNFVDELRARHPVLQN